MTPSQLQSLAVESVKENLVCRIYGASEFIRKSKLRERLGIHRNTLRKYLTELAPELTNGKKNCLIPKSVGTALIARVMQ